MNGRAHLERELKLAVPNGFSLARLPRELNGYIASPASFLRLHTVYYDSSDLRLTRWGCSLRFRHGEGWTLKIPVLDTRNGDELSRMEHVYASDEDRVPTEAIELASAFLRGAPVTRVAELRTVRVKRTFAWGDTPVADVVEDDVRVVDGTHVAQRFEQLEVELKEDGDLRALDSIAHVLQDRGAGGPDHDTKNVKALGALSAPEVTVPALDADATIGEVVRAALGSALVQYMHSEPLLRTGNDIEAVHKARVAVRKLRSHLHAFAPVLDEAWALGLRERLRGLQDVLAPVRDADVFSERMAALAQRLPHPDLPAATEIIDSLRAAMQQHHDRLRLYLRDRTYLQLLDAVVEGVRSPRLRSDGSDPASRSIDAIMQRVFKAVRKRVRKAGPQPSDRALHCIRIKAKHLRYAAESFCEVAGAAAASFASRVEALQELLGTQHDGVVAVTRLRAFSGSPQARFAAGELAMLALEDGARACDEWARCWHSLAKKRRRFW